ncbi:MAG: copper amine oxidase N-terminal domain-containing protein [Defluviitaleaceae bacterium]|nr:copper amine oxidase N-terminal domain-containing protein [Defluviitaleaceae bacterium]
MLKTFIKISLLTLVGAFVLANTTLHASEVDEETNETIEAIEATEATEEVENGLPVFTGEGVEYAEDVITTDDGEVPADMPVIRNFMPVTGEVSEIEELIYGESRITLVNEDGETIAILTTDYFTHLLGNEVAVGDTITAFYPANVPMLMIWPPQHTVRLIVNGDFINVAIDVFNLTDGGNLVSADEMLQLNFNDGTQILLQDGQNFRDAIADYAALDLETALLNELDGRTLVVVYGPTTMSIPAQTIPGADGTNLTITVLFEPIVAGPAPIDVDFDLSETETPETPETPQYEPAVTLPATLDGLDETAEPAETYEPAATIMPPPVIDDIANIVLINPISVNNVIIPATWVEQNGVFLVPLRSVLIALNLDSTITWDEATRSIGLSNGTQQIQLSVGSNEYVVDDQTITLDTAPVIIDSHTFVPFNFFSLIFGMNNAFFLEGQVFIDNEEPML